MRIVLFTSLLKTEPIVTVSQKQYRLLSSKEEKTNAKAEWHLIAKCTLLLFVAFNNKIIAQENKRGANAIFGSGIHLDFNSSPRSVTLIPDMAIVNFATDEGSASISDRDGNLLFYTNGVNVWGADDRIMPNGFGVKGNEYATTATQVIIIPIPKDPFRYYIFSPQYQGGDLKYAIVDMRLNSEKGDVVIKDQLLFEKSSEKLCVVKHASKEALWLITHEYGTNTFRAYLIDENGIDTDPVLSHVGLVHSENFQLIPPNLVYGTNAIGYLKPSHSGNLLASAVAGGMGTLEIFQFDTSNGEVSDAIKLFDDRLAGAYGVEFSPDDSKLYFSTGLSRILYQFDLSSFTGFDILNSRYVVGEKVSGALQLAPDGQIYCVPFTNSGLLSTIENPNESGIACNFTDQTLDLKGETVWLGLPEMLYNTIEPEILYNGFCPFSPTTFELINIKSFKSILWDFGDPSSGSENFSNDERPTHIYLQDGIYNVSITVEFDDASVFRYSQRISLFSLPEVNLGKDSLICEFNTITVDANPNFNPYTFNWSTGSAASSITVHESGEYWVTVNDGMCVASDTIKITYISLPSLVVNDTSLCNGEVLDLTLPDIFDYTWLDNFQGNRRVIADAGKYHLKGTHRCGTREENFEVSFVPMLTLSLPSDTILCKHEELKLDVTNLGAKYLWNDGSSNPTFIVKTEGLYSVQVYNRCELLSQSFLVRLFSEQEPFIPNVITPDGDGKNDAFVLDEYLPDPKVTILNRWGETVFYSSSYSNNWNASDCSPGQYYYLINDECAGKMLKGSLRVIKEQ